jgi:aspartate beta-hydroxylase
MSSHGLDRFAEYLSSVGVGRIDPVMGTYPGLSSQRWYDSSNFPVCSALEANFSRLRKEILALPKEIFHSESEPIPRTGAWTIYPILELGKKNLANAARLPTVDAIANQYGAIQTLAGAIYVSKLAPGSTIAAHRGPTNTRVRCHLGIQVPTGDCAIEVAGDRLSWTTGKCLVLNDHLEHRVWNRTNLERIVLVVDIWHPELTDIEKTLLTGLHVYAYQQTAAISMWHQRNLQAQKGRAPAGS